MAGLLNALKFVFSRNVRRYYKTRLYQWRIGS